MERVKVTISKKMSRAIEDSILNYNGDKDQLVFDYLNRKSSGFVNDKIAPILMKLDSDEFAGIVWNLVDVEVKESFADKKEKWKEIIVELKEGELVSERKRGNLVEEALKDFGIL